MDRDLSSILVRCDNQDDCEKAVALVNALMVDCQKLTVVLRFDTSDAWVLPMILGKGGANIRRIEKDTDCSIEIFKDEVTVVVSAEEEEIVAAGKRAVERIVEQARKECVFLDLPESSVSYFIGKGGAGIKKLSADHDVQIDKLKKSPSTVRITGKEHGVASARAAVLMWVQDWEASHVGTTIELEEPLVRAIIGKGGETVRAMERDTGCRIDINRQHCTLTVRDGTAAAREDALGRIRAIVEDERAKAAVRVAARAMAKQEYVDAGAAAKGAAAAAPPTRQPPAATTEEGLAKDRSDEFTARPLGSATVAEKREFNPAIDGTEEGRQLYRWIMTGRVGDAIADVVYPDSDSADEAGDNGAHGLTVVVKRDGAGNEVTYYQSASGFSVRGDYEYKTVQA